VVVAVATSVAAAAAGKSLSAWSRYLGHRFPSQSVAAAQAAPMACPAIQADRPPSVHTSRLRAGAVGTPPATAETAATEAVAVLEALLRALAEAERAVPAATRKLGLASAQYPAAAGLGSKDSAAVVAVVEPQAREVAEAERGRAGQYRQQALPPIADLAAVERTQRTTQAETVVAAS